MTRPKNAVSAETHEQILGAARSIIADEGVAAVSLRKVAERCGRSVGAVSYYFPKREDLLEACSEQNFQWIASQVHEGLKRVQKGEDWRSEVDAFVRALFRATRENQGLVRIRILSTMKGASIPAERLSRRLLPQLERVALVLGGSKGIVEIRLAAHTLELLVQRYGLHTDDEVCAIVGTDDVEFAVRSIEHHLVQTCIQAFGTALRHKEA